MKHNIKLITLFVGLSSITFFVLCLGKKTQEIKSVQTTDQSQIVEVLEIKSNPIQRKKASKSNLEASQSTEKIYVMSSFMNNDIESIANEAIQLPEED